MNSFQSPALLFHVLFLDECVTDSGNMVGRKCIFPFKYKGVFYDGCITESNHAKPWCTVVTDSNGVGAYIPRKWGYCPNACKLGKTNIEALSG